MLGLYLMQTDLTCLRSVRPSMIFSMPSIFKVRMPLSTDIEKISARRALLDQSLDWIVGNKKFMQADPALVAGLVALLAPTAL